MLEPLNEEIKRRTDVVRILRNAEACLRLVMVPPPGKARRLRQR